MKYCGNTTNLASHLKSQHPLLYAKAGFLCKKKEEKRQVSADTRDTGQQSLAEALKRVTKFLCSSNKSKELSSAVAYFIAKDMQPINVVQGEGFKHMIGKLEPRYQLPHRKPLHYI